MTQEQVDRLWRENVRLQEIVDKHEETIANYEKWLMEAQKCLGK